MLNWLSFNSTFKIQNFPLRLALLQPQFAPNLYDLAAMLKADRVVWEDVEKWSRKGRTHRTEIRGENGLQWINLPIMTEDKESAIKDVRIDHSRDWLEPMWNAIYHNYRTATYFDFYVDELRADFEAASQFEKLLDFDLYFFGRMMVYLELDLQPELASNIPEYDTFPDIFTENIGADILYLEHQSKNYQRQSRNVVDALEIHPEYRQAYKPFFPRASILDLLLNCGKESFKVIDELII
ncbi:MAG: WbqC family protein [Balneolaceae bacterium]